MPNCEDIRALADMARQRIVELTPQQTRQETSVGALLIDVRDDTELLRNPPLAGALHLTRGRLEMLICDAVADKGSPVVLYCTNGDRGALAADSLRQIGYRHVFNLAGGLRAWRIAAGQRWTGTDCRAA